jgi:hypothetical protein
MRATKSASDSSKLVRIQTAYSDTVRRLSGQLAAPLTGSYATPEELAQQIRTRLTWIAEADHALRELERSAVREVDEYADRLADTRQKLRANPTDGLRAFRALAVEAASQTDVQRLRELSTLGQVPAEAATVLMWRLASTATAFESDRIRDAGSFLSLSVDTMEVDRAFDKPTLARVALLLARIQVLNQFAELAAGTLAKAIDLGAPDGEVRLVQALAHRLAGDLETASALIQPAAAGGADPLAIATESVRLAKATGVKAKATNATEGQSDASGTPADPNYLWQLAESEVWASGSLTDVERRLRMTIEQTPSEIWAAIASRGSAEGDTGLAKTALMHARAATPLDQFASIAYVAELESEVAERAGELGRANDLLVEAATNLVWAGNLERAAVHFERVLERRPTDRDAAIGLADVIQARTYGRPLSLVIDEVIRGRNLIRGVLSDIDDATSWSLEALMILEQRLATAVRPQRWTDTWGELQAAALAVTFRPTDSTRWATLSAALSDVDLDGAAFTAASIALSHVSDKDPNRALFEMARSAVNFNATEETRAYGAFMDETVHLLFDAYIDAVTGRHQSAIDRLARATDIEHLPAWVSMVVIQCMAATGDPRLEKAASEAIASAIDKHDDFDWLSLHALALVATGRAGEALRITADIDAILRRTRRYQSGFEWHAAALIVSGDASGIPLLAAIYGGAGSPTELASWPHLARPTIDHAMREAGKEPLDLTEVDAVVAGRLPETFARADALVDLAAYRHEALGSDFEGRTLDLVDALIRLGSGDSEPLVTLLVGEGGPMGTATTAERVKTLARRLVVALNRASPDDSERLAQIDAVTASAAKHAAAALARSLPSCPPGNVGSLLRKMLKFDFMDSDVYIRNAQLSDAQRNHVLDALQEIAASGDEMSSGAAFALRYLQPTEAVDDALSPAIGYLKRIAIPPSWLAVEDIQLAKVAFAQVLSGVSGDAKPIDFELVLDESLGADGFRIENSGEVVASGRASAKQRWAPTATQALVSASADNLGIENPFSDWIAFRSDECDDLDRWLTMDRLEAVARTAAVAATDIFD